MTTGAFSGDTIDVLMVRSDGNCEGALDGCTVLGTDLHHRRPRGMGGTSLDEVAGPANGLVLCRACHRWCEEHLQQARDLGLSISPNRSDFAPEFVPVYRRTQWVWLDNAGVVRKVSQADADAVIGGVA